MRRAILCLCLLPLPACSQSATPITIDVTAGQETTAFTDAMVSTCSINVQSVETPTPVVNTTVTAAPGQTFDIPGDIASTEQVGITVACNDISGTEVMAGESLSGLLLGAVTSAIPVFVQRIEQWARPPGGLVCSHVGGTATVAAERYMMLTGGTHATSDTTCDMSLVDGYDIFSLDGDEPEDIFGGVPDTVVSLDSISMVFTIVGENASLVDPSGTSSPTPLGVPSPLTSFADVAGGAVVFSTTNAYVVGPTRSGKYGPSQMVLEISSDGSTLNGYKLSAPRRGAAATWVQNGDGNGFAGLVVAGGNGADGVAGVELLAGSGTMFQTLPYPPDGIAGAGAVYDGIEGNEGIYLFGGVDGTTPGTSRHLPLACNPCTLDPSTMIGTTGLPALTGVSAFRLPTGANLVLGTEVNPTGMYAMYRSFIVDTTNLAMVSVKEKTLREPRSGATPFPSPNGTLTVLGGQHADGTPALSIELFQP